MKNFIPASPWCNVLCELEAETEFIRFFKRMEIEKGISSSDIEKEILLWRKWLEIVSDRKHDDIEKNKDDISEAALRKIKKNSDRNFYECIQTYFGSLNKNKAYYTDFRNMFDEFIEYVTNSIKYDIKEYAFAAFFPVRIFLTIIFSAYLLSSRYFEEYPAWIQIIFPSLLWTAIFFRSRKNVYPLLQKIYGSFLKKNIFKESFILLFFILFSFFCIKFTAVSVVEYFNIRYFICKIFFYELLYMCFFIISYNIILILFSLKKKNIANCSVPVSDLPSLTLIVPAYNTRNYMSFEELTYKNKQTGNSVFSILVENNIEDFIENINSWRKNSSEDLFTFQIQFDKNNIKNWLKNDLFIKSAFANKTLKNNIEQWCNTNIQSLRSLIKGFENLIFQYNNNCAFQEFGCEYNELSVNNKKNVDKIIADKLNIILFSDVVFFSEFNDVVEKIRKKLHTLNDDEKDLIKLTILKRSKENSEIIAKHIISADEFNADNITAFDIADMLSLLDLRMNFDGNNLLNDWFMTSSREKLCKLFDISQQEVIGLNLSLNFSEKDFFIAHKEIIKVFTHYFSEKDINKEISRLIPEIRTDICMFVHAYSNITKEFSSALIETISLFKQNKDISSVEIPCVQLEDNLNETDTVILNYLNFSEKDLMRQTDVFGLTITDIYSTIFRVSDFFLSSAAINHYSLRLSYGIAKDFILNTMPGRFSDQLNGKKSITSAIFNKVREFSDTQSCFKKISHIKAGHQELCASSFFQQYIFDKANISFCSKFNIIFQLSKKYFKCIILLLAAGFPFLNFFPPVFFFKEGFFIGCFSVTVWLFVISSILFSSFDGQFKKKNIIFIIRSLFYSPVAYCSEILLSFKKDTEAALKYLDVYVFLIGIVSFVISILSVIMCPVKTALFWMFFIPCAHLSLSLLTYSVKYFFLKHMKYGYFNRFFLYSGTVLNILLFLIYYVLISNDTGYDNLTQLKSTQYNIFKTFIENSSLKTGLPASIIENNVKQEGVMVKDIALTAILDNQWSYILLNSMRYNMWNNWDIGYIKTVSYKNGDILKNEINTETNIWCALAFIHNRNISEAEKIVEDVLIPKIDENIGGILYGVSSFYHTDGRRFDYIKDTYQNILAWGLLDSLYAITKKEQYKKSKEKIRQFIVQMYNTQNSSFLRKSIFHNDMWINDQDIFYQLKCSAAAVLSLTPHTIEKWFGKGETDKILQQAKNRSYFNKEGVSLYDNTDPKTNYETANRGFAGFLEETIIMAMACREAGKYYRTVNMITEAQKWEDHYRELMVSIKTLVYNRKGQLYFPYSVVSYEKRNATLSLFVSVWYLLNEKNVNPFRCQ